MIPVHFLLCVAFVLFLIGTLIVLIRRKILMILMGLEIMLNAVALVFLVYSQMHGNREGYFFVLFMFVIAAIEVGLLIAIILNVFRWKKTLDISQYNLLK